MPYTNKPHLTKAYSSEQCIYQKGLWPLDILDLNWDSIEDFENYVDTKLGITSENFNEGLEIRVLNVGASETTYTKYVYLGGEWVELNQVSSSPTEVTDNSIEVETYGDNKLKITFEEEDYLVDCIAKKTPVTSISVAYNPTNSEKPKSATATISSNVPGSTIYYKLTTGSEDFPSSWATGSTVTLNTPSASESYSKTYKIKGMSTYYLWDSAETSEQSITVYRHLNAPTITLLDTKYDATRHIKITSDSNSTVTYYTLDGTNITDANGTVYSAGTTGIAQTSALSANKIKAISYAKDSSGIPTWVESSITTYSGILQVNAPMSYFGSNSKSTLLTETEIKALGTTGIKADTWEVGKVYTTPVNADGEYLWFCCPVLISGEIKNICGFNDNNVADLDCTLDLQYIGLQGNWHCYRTNKSLKPRSKNDYKYVG